MRINQYKFKMIKKDLIRYTVIAITILIITLIVTIIVSNGEREQLYIEGGLKSTPLISNDTLKRLGNLYINLNREFEQQIKEVEIGYANRVNRRGDRIYYGVNGKENTEEVENDDYVNGIQSITYQKGNADRKDGESNFSDMITVLSTTLGEDIDRYDDSIDELFAKLFWMSHTYTGTSTELYPCEHGCAWTKYYCGDYMCQGTIGTNTVGFYKSDYYMGRNNEYGLMYDPFLIKNKKRYQTLMDMLGNRSEFKTTYQYKDLVPVEVSDGEGGTETVMQIRTLGDTVVSDAASDTNEIFELAEIGGICPVCSGGREVFSESTRKFAGCINHVTCHHGDIGSVGGEGEDDESVTVYWYMDRNPMNCDNCEAVYECDFNYDDATDEEVDEHRNEVCKPDEIGCKGYYVCDTGHEHYACPGHILVCCFGHTNLNLTIKIMYFEEMLDEFKKIISTD